MNYNVLKARIKRNYLAEYAGEFYRDMDSEIVTSLNQEGKKALVGIQKKGTYTILGEEFLYYSTDSGTTGEIGIKSFLDILHNYVLSKGKTIFSRCKYVSINDEDKVWIHNKQTMSSLMNTILYLEKIE